MRKPCKRKQKAIGFTPDDAEADENDGDRVERGAEKQEGLVVMEGTENFRCRKLGFEYEHCPDGKRQNLYWQPWRSEVRGC